MPVDASIEEHEDGSKTIWFSAHDPMVRMKGMHGVCLHPGKSYLEVKVRATFFEPKVKKALVIGIVIAVFQQWWGINVIFNYAADIFANAGYSVSDTLFNIVITGAVNVVFTIAALWLIDRWGRGPLMLFGAISLCISYILLGSFYAFGIHGPAVLVLVLVAIGCYAVSLAPVAWVVISEIFPNRFRRAATSLAVGAV